MTLELTIVTADKRFHYPRLSQAVIPTPMGQIGILPGHASLIGLVSAGVLHLHPADRNSPSGKSVLFALDSGMAWVNDDRVVLLLSDACPSQEIDRAKAIERGLELADIMENRALLGTAERHSLEEEAAFNKAQLDALDATAASR